MLTLNLARRAAEPLRVLCVGAHSDDIEIGCGGTILKLGSAHPQASFHWVVLSADAEREREARHSAGLFLPKTGDHQIVVQRFRDGFFPYVGTEIKEYFEALKQQASPDVIFTHYRGDRHQDHRLISELTWNTFRDHLILEYEVPKYDGDLGSPNCYVPLDEALDRKSTRLNSSHSQISYAVFCLKKKNSIAPSIRSRSRLSASRTVRGAITR